MNNEVQEHIKALLMWLVSPEVLKSVFTLELEHLFTKLESKPLKKYGST